MGRYHGDGRNSELSMALVNLKPIPGDTDNLLLMKIAQSLHTQRSSTEEPPRHGDNNVTLLAKICQILSEGVGEFAPKQSDSENDLLRKWCALANAG